MLYYSVLCNRATKQTGFLQEFCSLEGGTDFRQRNTWINWDTTMKGKYGILRNYSAGYVLVYFVWSKKLLQGDPSKLRPRSGSKSGDKSPPNPAGGRGIIQASEIGASLMGTNKWKEATAWRLLIRGDRMWWDGNMRWDTKEVDRPKQEFGFCCVVHRKEFTQRSPITGFILQGKHYRDNSEEVVKQVNVVVQEGEELPVPRRN